MGAGCNAVFVEVDTGDCKPPMPSHNIIHLETGLQRWNFTEFHGHEFKNRAPNIVAAPETIYIYRSLMTSTQECYIPLYFELPLSTP